jgi:hypothetical protein
MKTRTMRMNPAVHMLALAAVLALGAPVIANAAVVSYTATLSGSCRIAAQRLDGLRASRRSTLIPSPIR